MSEVSFTPRATSVTTETALTRRIVIGVVMILIAVLLFAPLIAVFAEALRSGWAASLEGLASPDAQAAIRLTLIVAASAVPLNAAFGIAAAWAITKFDFRGKALLITLIDLPFSVSPVVAGLALVMLFGTNSWLGAWLIAHDLKAALTLGASGWRTFFTVTLPNIRWALLYGVLLCNARAMGEFGAVAVISGKIRGETTTMPIMIEMLYNEYLSVAAFSLAAVLALLALLTLLLKSLLEWRYAGLLAATRRH
ncbi:sulfate ABC transporter permease [Celeribacter sp.]|uniref:sulfate ABC transporter permease n=1 Tax=Celeribacter sp. TaxID=1890673 RepID=UPI003A93EBB9